MRFSAAILAGGLSRRMGRDKAWLPFRGGTLLALQVNRVEPLGPDEVFICGRPNVDYTEFGKTVLLDRWKGCGPLGGIERALAVARNELVLVLAVVLPFMNEGVLRQLLAKCSPQSGAVPRVGKRLEPLAAIYPRRAHSAVARMLCENRLAARDFVAVCVESGLVRPVELTEQAAGAFVNWNTPADVGGSASIPQDASVADPARDAVAIQPTMPSWKHANGNAIALFLARGASDAGPGPSWWSSLG